jgi:hypothetical protein
MCDLASGLVEQPNRKGGDVEQLHAYLPHDQYAYRLAFARTNAQSLCAS